MPPITEDRTIIKNLISVKRLKPVLLTAKEISVIIINKNKPVSRPKSRPLRRYSLEASIPAVNEPMANAMDDIGTAASGEKSHSVRIKAIISSTTAVAMEPAMIPIIMGLYIG